MTDLDLDAIEARANAAAPGPPWGWAVSDDRRWVDVTARGHDRVIATTYDDDLAAFIAHARTDVPALVAEVRRLRESLDEGFAAIALAGAEIERASVEVDRAHRALLASNAERDDARAAIAHVRALDPADHATSSRDYGRGYAQAIRDIRAAIDGTA